MTGSTFRAARLAAPLALALALGACGGSDSPKEKPAAGAGSRAPTVSVMKVEGVGDVLVDGTGRALYASDEEAGAKVLCVDGCTAIWEPVLTGAAKPTAGAGVSGRLAVVRRADGGRQVTVGGKPLYRFTQDPGAGEVTGNGVKDSFDGVDFTWHALAPDGAAARPASAEPPSDRGDYGY